MIGYRYVIYLLLLICGCGFNNPFKPPLPPKPIQVELLYPSNGDTLSVKLGNINFVWKTVQRRESYNLQVSRAPEFDSLILDTTTLEPSFLYHSPDTVPYFWRVKVKTLTYHQWSDWSTVWKILVKRINNPPDTPQVPSPLNNATSVSRIITLEWVSGDPDGDTVFYSVGFGKDTLSLVYDTITDPTGIRPAHLLYDLDTLEYSTQYYWQVSAKDYYDAMSPGPVWKFTTGDSNDPTNFPNTPVTPTGPVIEYIDKVCSFTTQTTDPDGNDVRYKFDFGDGFQSNWTGFVTSGQPGSVSHTYTQLGTFYVKAKAQDINYNESAWSDSANIKIKVGPGACWVADYSGNKVVKLGVGGSKVCQFDNQGEPPWHYGGFTDPLTLRVDPIDGCCWVACSYIQGIFKLADNCSLLVWYLAPEGVFENPSTPCIDRNHDCWVTLAQKKILMKYERYTMNKLDSIIDFIGEYVYPIAIDYDIDNDWIWVVERNHFGMGYISKIDAISHNVLFRKEGFNALWVEVDPVTHYCWVADQENSLVAKISPDGNAQRFSGFLDPSCVSVEPAVAVWVADAGHSEIVKLSYDGTELFRVTGVVDSATAVEVDPNDGSCWVSDAGNNRVIKLSATGNMLFEITDFIIPMGLSLSPAPDPE